MHILGCKTQISGNSGAIAADAAASRGSKTRGDQVKPEDLLREPRVYVIILNWNGWRDTIACLESVLRLAYANLCLVVCDNGSTDDSVRHITHWANAKLPCRTHGGQLMASMVVVDSLVPSWIGPQTQGNLFLLQNHENRGFAGGNNAGLQFALARGDFDYAWLLNNDTVVEPSSLTHLVQKMQSTENAGICGSTLLYDENPKKRVGGAVYSKWFARTRFSGSTFDDRAAADEEPAAREIHYVVGASMLVRRAFLEEVGLMSEGYFLYFEELDWMLRARHKYRFAYAPHSVVHHKGGAATGATRFKKSVIGEYYGTRSRILFTRKFYPYALPTVVLAILFAAFAQLLKGRLRIALTIMIGARDGVRGRTGIRADSRKSLLASV